MPVTVMTRKGKHVARRGFHALDNSGAPQDIPYDMRVALDRAGIDPASIEGGEVVIVADGQVIHRGFGGDYPRKIHGHTGGAGPLNAKLDILNYGYTADRSFTVERTGGTDAGQAEFRTTIDGQVVEEGWTRPFQISWEANDAASTAGFVGADRLEFFNGERGSGGGWL
jgi:hypothetical protein